MLSVNMKQFRAKDKKGVLTMNQTGYFWIMTLIALIAFWYAVVKWVGV